MTALRGKVMSGSGSDDSLTPVTGEASIARVVAALHRELFS
jgi:hypothetical protein